MLGTIHATSRAFVDPSNLVGQSFIVVCMVDTLNGRLFNYANLSTELCVKHALLERTFSDIPPQFMSSNASVCSKRPIPWGPF